MTNKAEQIAAGLTDDERRAVRYCERDGNVRYAYQLHSLAHKGLMALTPVEGLQGVSAYRLTPLGLSVREYLERQSDGK
jgi:hypothetical protein